MNFYVAKPCHRSVVAYRRRGTAAVNSQAHQPPQIASANGIDICYDIFGDTAAEPILLIMGLGCQMIHWDDDFCRQLAARGFRVIRFDNRDTGKSSKLTGGKRLTALELLKLRFLQIPVAAPYKISDMAADTVGLMDALNLASAHLVGVSMGGMIAQEIAISFPQRVRSLTSIMSTTGDPKVPPPTRKVAAMLMLPPPAGKEAYLKRFAQTWKLLRVGSFPRGRSTRSRPGRTCFRARTQSGRCRAATPRCPCLRQPQATAGVREGAHTGDSRHGRSPGAFRGRQGHRPSDSRRKIADDPGHGPCVADPDVAASNRCDRGACAWSRSEGCVGARRFRLPAWIHSHEFFAAIQMT